MSSDYQVTLHRPDGRPVATLTDNISISMARAINAVGVLQLTVPVSVGFSVAGYSRASYRRDSRIVIRRRPSPIQPWRLVGDTIWFVRLIELILDQTGEYQLKITAYDTLNIVNRRIIAYDAETPESDKTAEADAMIKEIMRENFGTLATDPDRDLSDYLLIAADLPATSTPSISKSFAHKNVLTTLQEICQSSATEGTWLAFDVVAQGVDQLQFRTYVNQRGQDRRVPMGTSPLILAPEHENMGTIESIDDYISEVTFVYAGGTGEGGDRIVETASDPVRIAASPFNRIEEWRDSRNTADPVALEDEAQSLLRQKRPRRILSGTVVESPACLFGVHYDYGDYVTAQFDGDKFDCRIEAFKIDLNNTGEKIDVKLRVEADG